MCGVCCPAHIILKKMKKMKNRKTIHIINTNFSNVGKTEIEFLVNGENILMQTEIAQKNELGSSPINLSSDLTMTRSDWEKIGHAMGWIAYDSDFGEDVIVSYNKCADEIFDMYERVAENKWNEHKPKNCKLTYREVVGLLMEHGGSEWAEQIKIANNTKSNKIG